MPHPPNEPPPRPLQQASILMYLLGVAMLLPSIVVVVISRNLISASLTQASAACLLLLFVFLSQAALYFVGAFFVSRRRTWAVVLGLVLGWIHLAFTIMLLIGAALITVGLAMPAGITLLFFAGVPAIALGALIDNLLKSHRILKQRHIHGFEPLMVRPVEPVPLPSRPTIIEPMEGRQHI